MARILEQHVTVSVTRNRSAHMQKDVLIAIVVEIAKAMPCPFWR